MVEGLVDGIGAEVGWLKQQGMVWIAADHRVVDVVLVREVNGVAAGRDLVLLLTLHVWMQSFSEALWGSCLLVFFYVRGFELPEVVMVLISKRLMVSMGLTYSIISVPLPIITDVLLRCHVCFLKLSFWKAVHHLLLNRPCFYHLVLPRLLPMNADPLADFFGLSVLFRSVGSAGIVAFEAGLLCGGHSRLVCLYCDLVQVLII